MIVRLLSSVLAKSTKSVLLLGPRQTGKSTLLSGLSPALTIDLSDQQEFFEYQSDPGLLRRVIEARQPKTVFIDEIQRIPELTNTVQSIVDRNKKIKFFLSGSSARKLKRGQANLLPGRILGYKLGPLCLAELDYQAPETAPFSYGFLPEVWLEKTHIAKEKLLRSYSATYLREEVQAESLVRALPSFVRFLNVAALHAGHFLDLSKISHKAKVPRQSAVRHFEILEDTMIAQRVLPDPGCPDLDLVKHPKFYFFDTGVLNGLLGNFIASPDRMGLLFEHTFASQIFASCHARDITPELFTFRTRGGLEIDFILRLNQLPIAIELKSTDSIHSSDIATFERALKVYPGKITGYLVYRGSKEQKQGGIWILPWTKFFKAVGL